MWFKIINKEIIKNNLIQIIALTELKIKLRLRFKFSLVLNYINPLITIIIPLIIMGAFFKFNEKFGPWTQVNYFIFMFMAYNIILLRGTVDQFLAQIYLEKYWKTLTALMIAPFNRINLLFGVFISQLIVISIPFTVFLILCYIVYPISVITVIIVLIIYFLIALIFSGIGILIGVFVITNENILVILRFLFNLMFWFSCIVYPFEVFPEVVQNLISLNPLYYIFDFLRVVWIENDFIYSINNHKMSFVLLILSAIFIPILSVIIFNEIYKKFGISGY